MAWTQSDVDALKAALAKGVKVLRMDHEWVEFQSTSDMMKTLRLMEAEVAGKPAASFDKVTPVSSRGFCP